MKITLIMSPFLELPPIAIGAVEKLFYQLAGEWVNNGNEVAFVCCGGGDDKRMKFVRLKKYNRTSATKKDVFWDLLYSIKALWKCPKTDILLCNTFWSPVLAPLFRWKYKRLVYGVHRYPKGQFWLYPFVHAFICVSTAVVDELKRQLGENRNIQTINNPVDVKVPHSHRGRIFTIVNPIDETVFNDAAQRQPIKGRVLYAGRVHPAKGLSCLAKACKRLHEHGECSELVLVGVYDKAKGGGGDAFVRALRDAAAPCPVTVTGAISDPSRLADIERTAEVFVYPSEDALGEACPIAPMEAMALGVPTVVSDMACYKDYVLQGENADMFKCADDSSLANCIGELMRDSDRATRIASKAVQTMKAYSRTNVAHKYECIMKELF